MLVYEWIEEGVSVPGALELRLRMSHQHGCQKCKTNTAHFHTAFDVLYSHGDSELTVAQFCTMENHAALATCSSNLHGYNGSHGLL